MRATNIVLFSPCPSAGIAAMPQLHGSDLKRRREAPDGSQKIAADELPPPPPTVTNDYARGLTSKRCGMISRQLRIGCLHQMMYHTPICLTSVHTCSGNPCMYVAEGRRHAHIPLTSNSGERCVLRIRESIHVQGYHGRGAIIRQSRAGHHCRCRACRLRHGDVSRPSGGKDARMHGPACCRPHIWWHFG